MPDTQTPPVESKGYVVRPAKAKAPLVVSIAVATDLPFVTEKWVSSYSRAMGIARSSKKNAYLLPSREKIVGGERDLATRLLQRSQVRVVKQGEALLSFVVVDLDDNVVHYAWTAEHARHRGYIRKMLSDIISSEGWIYTKQTYEGREVGDKLKGTYDPYLLHRLSL